MILTVSHYRLVAGALKDDSGTRCLKKHIYMEPFQRLHSTTLLPYLGNFTRLSYAGDGPLRTSIIPSAFPPAVLWRRKIPFINGCIQVGVLR